ncbi:MAG TPA: 2-polyprenyl-3-methyl-6-methoxy-1,4-benzoquinone monooxygenase [Burkholderiales bacterium]|nr:2-polyprenyl-3-methyl-6-methoxy-1,4-benzoquinone monooxygenase [Burkholderiales bacterium]
MSVDRFIIPFDRALRTLFSKPTSARKMPGEDLPEAQMEDDERQLAAGLMRVNHTGEICAQALYEGQLLAARKPCVRDLLSRAAKEETEHLAWTERRLEELGARKSILDPLFYLGSFALGSMAGALGDRWSLGFLVETERQVEQHLSSHLDRLPAADSKSRAIVEQMREDEVNHALSAQSEGGVELPLPIRLAMRAASTVMTATTRWI